MLPTVLPLDFDLLEWRPSHSVQERLVLYLFQDIQAHQVEVIFCRNSHPSSASTHGIPEGVGYPRMERDRQLFSELVDHCLGYLSQFNTYRTLGATFHQCCTMPYIRHEDTSDLLCQTTPRLGHNMSLSILQRHEDLDKLLESQSYHPLWIDMSSLRHQFDKPF
jgi:hypothetical protein